MGLYDRDYYRDGRPAHLLRGPQTVVGALILINVAVYLADGLFTPRGPGENLGAINNFFALKLDALFKPWLWWEFITYGFAHSSFPEYWHILGNMLTLFFLGPAVEARYGSREFFRLYLVMLVVAGVAWSIMERLGGHPLGAAVGASGAITGVVILFALNFPRQTLLLFYVFPMPAWMVGVLVVLIDVYRGFNPGSTAIAWSAHLGGAAFALLYYTYRWNFTQWTSGWLSASWLKPRPKLRVHDPDRKSGGDKEHDDLGEEVDRILEKIHRQGEASLTRKERRTLETASRQYQKKRQSTPDDRR